MTRKLTVAVAGATGAVGEEMLRLLDERGFPLASLKLLASSRSAGTKLRFPTCAGPELRFACWPVSEVTRTVMVPFPVSGCRTK